MDLFKQLKDQGITLAAVLGLLIIFVWDASELNSTVEHLGQRLEVVNRKVDRANVNISNVKSEVNRVKMDAHGLEMKIENVDKDLARVSRTVSLGTSNSSIINRKLQKLLNEFKHERRPPMKETATKAWAGAFAGIAIALINILTSFLTNGQVEPVMIDQLGVALGTAADGRHHGSHRICDGLRRPS